MDSIFYQLAEESIPGRLGEKRERDLCAMPSPQQICEATNLQRPLSS